MDADERDICNFLRAYPGQFISGGEIARRAAGRHRLRADAEWAAPVLTRLVEQGILENDYTGHYRLRQKPRKEKPAKWVSPQIKKILEQSGKDFGDLTKEADAEEEF